MTPRRIPGPANRRVAVIVCDGVAMFELGITLEVFALKRPELGVPWYDVAVVSFDPPPLRGTGGIGITPTRSVRALATAGTIVIPSWPRLDEAPPPAMLDAVRKAYARGARLLSICSGAFVLAAAGLLDDRPATTHWLHAPDLARRHPHIRIDPNVLYVDDGDILTSAGTAASIDLCLHLVRKDFGAEIANIVARRLVVPPHRDGGQAQYVDHPVADHPGVDWFDEALAWAEANLRDPITIEDLASRSAMSTRTFTRRFRAATGTTPHAWLTRQRVQLAQRLLETTDRSVEWIAGECGLGTAANLRLHFQRIVCTSPLKYRRTFQVRASA